MIVVPCFDEQDRINPTRLLDLLGAPALGLLLVDDGSRDRTPEILERLEAESNDVSVLRLPHNHGKAEAVRAGLQAAVRDGADLVAYCDADLSTPPEEMLRLIEILRGRQDLQVVLGARVSLLGHEVRRSAGRHYLGRVFASCASIVLGLGVYDTQCGAKVFRVSSRLRRALAQPFGSRWAFDVELLGRLIAGGPGVDPLGPDQMLEVPLQRWADVKGSKLAVRDMVSSGVALLRVRAKIRHSMQDTSVGFDDQTARTADADCRG